MNAAILTHILQNVLSCVLGVPVTRCQMVRCHTLLKESHQSNMPAIETMSDIKSFSQIILRLEVDPYLPRRQS